MEDPVNTVDEPDSREQRVTEAIDAITRGDIVVVTDDERRENEGDLIMAAGAATPEKVAFFLQHTSGVICAALTGQRLDALGIPLMVDDNREHQGTAFTISVDLSRDVTTGISASDRSRTLRALASPEAEADDFVRPGHIFPLRASDGGVLKRAGHTEAAVDLATMAGREPAGVLCEIVSEDKQDMARGPELQELAAKYGLPIVSIADLVRYRLGRERLVRQIAAARVPTRHGAFTCYAWETLTDGTEHLAFVMGDVTAPEPTLVRVHSECLTGDVFGSLRCDCGGQLDDAMEIIAEEGRGVVVYLRGHEGRGIGLAHKLEAYNLQDDGHDTVDANVELGLPVDTREYGIGSQILLDLGVTQLRLLTNNPAKLRGLNRYGLEVIERVALPPRRTAENLRYLKTKTERLGHLLPLTEPDQD